MPPVVQPAAEITQNWTTLIPIFVSVLALAGICITVLIQMYNNKRQMEASHAVKMADMRQGWINNLRDAMASFQSYAMTPGIDQDTTREFYEHGTKIELYMNIDDEDYPELHKRMYDFIGNKSADEKYSKNAAYVAVCQKILRREWLVVKNEMAEAHRVQPPQAGPSGR